MISLEQELLARRVVFITGRIDGALASRVAAELMTLDAMDSTPIHVYVDSTEGTLDAALALMDTIGLVHSPLYTQALGSVSGGAVGVLAVGSRRSAAPHALIRLTEPPAELTGSSGSLESQLEQQRRLIDSYRSQLSQATGRPQDEIAEDLRQGRDLDAQEAVTYGLIDTIAAQGHR